MPTLADRIGLASIARAEAERKAAQAAHLANLRRNEPPFIRQPPVIPAQPPSTGGLPYPWCYRRAECAAARCCVGNPTCGD